MFHKKPCSLASIIIFLCIVRTFPLQKARKSKSVFIYTKQKKARDTAELIREDKMLLETGVGIFFSSSSLSQLFFCPGANALASQRRKVKRSGWRKPRCLNLRERRIVCCLIRRVGPLLFLHTFLGVQTGI